VVREEVGKGGEMTQALYAHMNKKKKKKKKRTVRQMIDCGKEKKSLYHKFSFTKFQVSFMWKQVLLFFYNLSIGLGHVS
jgi:hypothetical protein